MPGEVDIVDLVHDILKADTSLAELKDWKKANGLVTLAASGCSVGLDEDDFEEYTREKDETTSNMRVMVWFKSADPVTGEAKVRELARQARLVLVKNRTLGGAVANSYVNKIYYATAEGGKSLVLHLADIDYRVKHYMLRMAPEIPVPIEQVNNEVSS